MLRCKELSSSSYGYKYHHHTLIKWVRRQILRARDKQQNGTEGTTRKVHERERERDFPFFNGDVFLCCV